MVDSTPHEANLLPDGLITFLFTDIEGSTRLWEEHLSAMSTALARHNSIITEAVTARGGQVFKTVGDSFYAVFSEAGNALAAAVEAQRSLNAEEWPGTGDIKVRMALHTGVAERHDRDYFGPTLNRVARLLAAGYGGQVLVTLAARDAIGKAGTPLLGAYLRSLGEHRLKDLHEPEQIYQVVIDGMPSDFPPLRTLNRRPNNLPYQPTAFIGRAQEVAGIAALMKRHDVRLATLTGPGGTGKTRLALQVGSELIDDFEDGIFFVGLSSLRKPSLVTSEIAQALGVRESPGRPLIEDLKEHLRTRQMLLIIDNFEHLQPASSLLSTLILSVPRLKVLVTSRAPLHLYGEREFPVPTMSLPPLAAQAPSVGQEYVQVVSRYEAVRLFVERAQAVRPGFGADGENIADIVEICRRLDGLPLAIELAAARAKLFPPGAMLQRLGSRLKLLAGGPRDFPARLRTLRNTIDWSYDLLDENERTLFQRLATFLGGCTLEAAETVAAMQDGDSGLDVLECIQSLVDNSLLRQDAREGEPRFSMLETIREYALDRLQKSGEADPVRRRHAAYFVELAEEAEAHLLGPKQGEWMGRLDTEHDNMRAVLDWSKGAEPETNMLLASVLWRFWYVRGYIGEAIDRLETALALGGGAESELSAKLRYGVGTLMSEQNRYKQAEKRFEENLAFYRKRGESRGIADALNALGIMATHQGHYDRARQLFTDALELRRTLGDREEIAGSLNNLAHMARAQGDHARAQALLEESLSIFEAIGDRRGASISLNNLGHVARSRGDNKAAGSMYEKSLSIKRELGDKLGAASSLNGMGAVARKEGDYEAARRFYLESLQLYSDGGDRQQAAACLVGLADVLRADGQDSTSARLIGLGEELLKMTGGAMDPATLQDYDAIRSAISARLTEPAWEAAVDSGRTMTLEEAIALARRASAGVRGFGVGVVEEQVVRAE